MFKNQYQFNPELILRTPFKAYRDPSDLSALEDISQKKDIKEALFLSSPDLVKQIDAWLLAHPSKGLGDKLKNAIYKYLVRMHSRCTPFGLMATCALVKWDKDTNITLRNERDFWRSTRLDMHYWGELLKRISNLPQLQDHLFYYPNSSVYQISDKLRYVEYELKGRFRNYKISSVDYSTYLKQILQLAKKGTQIASLVKYLIHENIDEVEAKFFISELIATQILVSELEPAVTGKEYVMQILPVLKRISQELEDDSIHTIIGILETVDDLLSKLDSNKHNDLGAYQRVFEALNLLDVKVDIDKLFQVDSYKNVSEAKLSYSIQRDLSKVVNVLEAIPKNRQNVNITEFRELFFDRYEYREVPILEALDNDVGIGYPVSQVSNSGHSPLVDNLEFKPQEKEELKWSEWENYLHEKVEECTARGSQSFTIDTNPFYHVITPPKALPTTMAIMFSHLGIIDGKNRLQLKSIGGSSAANMLARFSAHHGIRSMVKSIADKEQELEPGSLLCEIVHLPSSRVGNILHRPTLRDYEIPYLAKSSYPINNQITLDDILISVKNNRIYLRSKRLNREVVPRLTSAHNYHINAQPVYQFLGDLQFQDIEGGPNFSWGSLEFLFKFLPRVECHNVVLSPACWNLTREDYKKIIGKTGNDLEKFLKAFQEKFNLPQKVLIVEGDNHVLVDLKDPRGIKVFVENLKKRDFVRLTEFLFDPGTLPVRDTQGKPYINEFIAILERKKPFPLLKNLPPNIVKEKKIQSTFPIGSEWLYLKVYCGNKTSDYLLTEVFKPITEKALRAGLISRWFFIRYADPKSHIRIRFQLDGIDKLGKVIGLVKNDLDPLLEKGLVWNIMTDTYKREIKRYGSHTIELAESLFYHESISIVNMLAMITGDAGELIRWKFAIKAIDRTLDDFCYSTAAKLQLMDNLKTGFGREFGMNRDLKKQLDHKFRELRKNIEEILDNAKNDVNEIKPLLELLDERSANSKPYYLEILKRNENNCLEMGLDELLSSYIHMLMNRIFNRKQRLHEMILYDFMFRYYRSTLARVKNTNPIAPLNN